MAELAGSSWRLIGSVPRPMPSHSSWLAAPFLWVAKEAQPDGYQLAQLADLLPLFQRAAARNIGPGGPPTTGEEWIAAFGRREAAAAFPFSILEFLMSGIESGAATLEFRQGAPAAAVTKVSGGNGKGGSKGGKRGSGAGAEAAPLRMVSRVRVECDDGRVSGDLVTECDMANESRTPDGAGARGAKGSGAQGGTSSRSRARLVRPGGYRSPRYPTHFQPLKSLFHELHGIL